MKNEVIEAMMMGAKEIHKLRNENQKLQQRIDKSIEYIEQEKKKDEEDSFVDLYLEKYEEDLLNILKGEDK